MFRPCQVNRKSLQVCGVETETWSCRKKFFFPRLFGLVVTCCHEGRGRVLVRETFANPSTERSLFFKDKNTFFFCFLFLFVELTHLKTKKKKKKQGLQVHLGNWLLEGVVGRRGGGGEIQTFEVVFHLISDPKMDHLSSGPRYTPASVSHLLLFVQWWGFTLFLLISWYSCIDEVNQIAVEIQWKTCG